MSEAQLDLATFAHEQRAEQRETAEQEATALDEQRTADRLAENLLELHNAIAHLCPACKERVDEYLAGPPS